MATLLEVLRDVTLGVYALLAVLSFIRWRRRRDQASMWVMLTFALLAIVIIAGRVIPESDDRVIEFLETLLVAALLLTPYFLYRTATSFAPAPRSSDYVAMALTTIVVVAAVALPPFPEEGEPQPLYFRVFVYAVLVQWTVVSLMAAVRFWRGGRGETSVVRRRTRLLSAGAAALSLAIIVSGVASPGSEANVAAVVIQSLGIISAFAFFLGFAPPSWLLEVWRRRELDELRQAAIELMNAETTEEAAGKVLPRAVRLVGARGVTLKGTDGTIIATHGDAAAPEAPADSVTFDYSYGSLEVLTSRYTPFFGEGEIKLLGSLGALLNLSLERIAADQMRIDLETSKLKRRQALEINDNVVQGLAVAKYAFDMGDESKARSAVEQTLKAARSIISDLIDEAGGETLFGSSPLLRSEAAPRFDAPSRSAEGAPRREEEQDADSGIAPHDAGRDG